jgi:hypothetical protein
MSEFVLCISNKGYDANLIVGKVYQTVPDEPAQDHALIRVIDEDTSEPDGYLFPQDMFVAIEIPEIAEQALLGGIR